MNLDQASLLREMMQKNKKLEVKNPFAIFSTSQVEENEEVIATFVEKIKEKNKAETMILKNMKSSGKTFVETANETFISMEKMITESKEMKEEIIKVLERKEKKMEQIVIDSGKGVNYNTVNAALLVKDVAIVSDLSETSQKEIELYLKIIQKLGKKQRISLVLSAEENVETRQKINKIQGKVWDEFNCYIEVIGFYKRENENKTIAFETLELTRYEQKQEEQNKISISLKNRFF